MKAQQKWLTYAELELITPAQPKAQRSPIFGTLCNLLNNVLTLMAGNEPRIRQTIDTEGKIWWRVDDPRTGRSIVCESEQEVRVWLERQLF